MKGHDDILEALQKVLTMELTGINQYFLHSKMAKNWGYDRLAKFQWDESMDEMRHADKLMDRLLFLEGSPNMHKYHKIGVGDDCKAMLKADMALELRAIDTLKDGIDACFTHRDHASRELLEHILVDEEEHVDWLEAQLDKIEEIGLDRWLGHMQWEDGK